MLRAVRLVALPACLLLAGGNGRAVENVTIYRCVDAKGKLTLRDTPCAKGQRQQERTMSRPKDPPPGARAAAPATPPNAGTRPRGTYAPTGAVRYVVVNPPRPLYECTRPDDTTYTSDSPDGDRRYVPVWTLGYPVVGPRLGVGGRVGAATAGRPGVGMRPAPAFGAFYGGGTWVQDECFPLPQDEVCARLSDRRSELRRRFFNAMPSERETLGVEERGLNSRLRADCGID